MYTLYYVISKYDVYDNIYIDGANPSFRKPLSQQVSQANIITSGGEVYFQIPDINLLFIF